MADGEIEVEVFHQGEDGFATLRRVRLAAGATVADAVGGSGIDPAAAASLRPAVFGVLKELDDAVHDGDRVDLTRPLRIDPRDARRLRARAAKRG